MNKLAATYNIYRVIRGIVFTTVIFLIAVFLIVYILLSMPSFQSYIKSIVEKEATAYIGAPVEIGSLTIKPFNEVVLKDVRISDHNHRNCLNVEILGAGISLLRLIKDGRLILTYGEIIGMKAAIVQDQKDGPLNIQFIIDAFKPKDKNKPPSKLNLRLYNVVIRNSEVTFDKAWTKHDTLSGKTDFNHLRITDLRADIACPKISQEEVRIDLRRLAFNLSGGLDLETLSLKCTYTPTGLDITDLMIKLPATELRPNDISISYADPSAIMSALMDGDMSLILEDNIISLSDFGWLMPDLRRFSIPLTLSMEAEGNRNSLDINNFSLSQNDGRLNLYLNASLSNLDSISHLKADVKSLRLNAAEGELYDIITRLPVKRGKGVNLLTKIGRLGLEIEGIADLERGNYESELSLTTSRIGSVTLKGIISYLRNGHGHFKGKIDLKNLEAGVLSGYTNLGEVTGNCNISGEIYGKEVNGEANVFIDCFRLGGILYDGFTTSIIKNGKEYSLDFFSNNHLAYADITASALIDDKNSNIELHSVVTEMHPDLAFRHPKFKNSTVAFSLDARLSGNNLDNIQGSVKIDDFTFMQPDKPVLNLKNLAVNAETVGSVRNINLNSDWIDGWIKGDFKFKDVPRELTSMVYKVLPALMKDPGSVEQFCDMDFNFTVKPNNTWTEFLSLPVRLLVPVTIKGGMGRESGLATLDFIVPYLQQGKNKLVRDTHLGVRLDRKEGTAYVEGTTTFPGKKGDMAVTWDVTGQTDNISTVINLKSLEQAFLSGNIIADTRLIRNEQTDKPDVLVNILPSTLGFGSENWTINPATISFINGVLNIDDLNIAHGKQFVDIAGVASASPEDSLNVRLASVDIGYIFDTLNINYVTFSGIATGDISASGVFSKFPRALTDRLYVKDLSYNGAVLGDAVIRSHWDNDNKEVTILADIAGERGKQKVDGGIWVTRDSLSFDIIADKVPVEFMKPFVSAFSSDVRGHASGAVKLFGTFSDIDLVGDIFADSLALKLDYTNVWYHGSDSVRLRPGHINLPSFRLYDNYGSSAILTGDLTHRYFHDPEFNFRVSDAHNLLCYNTNSTMNPDWYGRIYGNGGAVIKGWPGTVSVSVDMSATGNSDFTFVLNETEAAADYRFLTFTDSQKEEAERLKSDTVPSVLSMFKKKVELKNDIPSKFILDIRGSVTPSTLFTLVMDPVAGDKITARGNGNMQVEYDSESNDMKMFGKYILDEGNYNFSLQDLFLRDFTIRRGSSISFNGDPLNALLDLTAAYRVNTNLSDLDKSFSTDRDLARTSVPVDALLKVNGNMQHPDITFDIELPTLTQDVERKVKSIISTEDMMSRQIIYLLALQRFYTPEYMGSSSNGSEFAAVASSTLSSQLSNMIAQLTDKFTLAPSFRSDKGDFSDLEVDVALSSRLLNNRLLINGNFGYRDKSTSTTTFVGDFDIEYLLSRNGNLRLKAYNHFNDQNYYLRQALTTQGLGIIYRKDFDNPFTFLKRRKKQSAPVENNDTIQDKK